MEVIIGQSPTVDFTVTDPLTGQVSDADFLPTCDVFENTTDTPLLSPAVVKRVGHLGDYRVSFDATIANGFEVGKSYNVVGDSNLRRHHPESTDSYVHNRNASSGTRPIDQALEGT